MAFDISRRFILGGAIGAGMAGMSGATGLLGKANAEAAFPPEGGLMDTPLLGPAEGMAQLSRNENPYGPSDSALKMIEYAGKKGAYYATEANMVLAKLIAERHGLWPQGSDRRATPLLGHDGALRGQHEHGRNRPCRPDA